MLALNFKPFPELVTARLHFRQLVPEDAEEIFRLRSNERVNKFLTRDKCKTVEEAMTFINRINRSISNNESIYWGITFAGEKKLIGTICLWNIQPENYRAEIGYELHPDFWGKGIMVEATEKVTRFAFDTMSLHSIQADTDPRNSQSVTLLDKSGFVKEGHFKESIYFNGKFSDLAVYSLVNKISQAES